MSEPTRESTSEPTNEPTSAATPEISRRGMLATTAMGVGGAAVLAACSSPGGTPDPSVGPSGPAPTESPSPAGGTGGGDVLAKLSDVPVGQAIAAKGPDGAEIIIAQPTAGKAVAFSAKCTHKGCAVAPVAKVLNCPCHGSKFDPFTGAVQAGPATAPLPAVPVRVDGGNVVAGP